jgi:uncharacterized protein DUF4166/saccharopine dehydrogenase-like protein
MTRVMVVGGARVFGARLVDGLAATTDACVVIAGRNRARSEAAALAVRARYPTARIETAVIDVRTATPEALRASGARIVVDAAGPFQGAEPRLATAAIAAGIDYLDLADARDFVARFPRLDGAARAAGVVAVTGMSSTPALSHAALALTAGWQRIDRVEVGISPGNRTPRGRFIVSAILAWAGQPSRVFVEGRWTSKRGWSGTIARRIGDLGARCLALAETPDLDLLVTRFQPRDAAWFRAGLELGILHHGLALLAWLPRIGVLRSLGSLQRPIRWISTVAEPFGTDCGGMIVEAAGRDAQDRPTVATWTLVAEAGDGPHVPTLPALALIRTLMADRAAIPASARAGAGLLSLDVIGREFSRLRINTDRTVVHPAAPFEVALQENFEDLPAIVKAAHRAGPVTGLGGTARIEGAESTIGALVARLFGFPPSSDSVRVRVLMRLDRDGIETWQRDFGGRRFQSRLQPSRRGMVVERFGPFSFDLSVKATDDGLTLRVVGWRLGKLRLPRRLAPKSTAVERVDADGRFCFDVPIALPLVGGLVRYRGSMTLEH